MNSPSKLGILVGVIVAFTAIASTLFSEPAQAPIKRSRISIYNLDDKSVKVIYTGDKLIEAPNWSRDGKYLLVNTGGDLYKLPVDRGFSGELQKIDLDSIARCNNDKGFSPNGKLIAFSSSAKAKASQVYTAPSRGGTPKLIVSKPPSYFHAFSPDGRWMAIVVGLSKENFNLFRVPTKGGKQQRLTSRPVYDDGPDYSPDGKWIYFNSNRSGSWDIWRMPAAGAGSGDANAQQVTSDELEDWFPHCSPDGKWLVFLTFPKGTSGHNDHLEVRLRMMPLPGDTIDHPAIRELTHFFGGQGTINVNSWAPDSRKFAFVRYEQ